MNTHPASPDDSVFDAEGFFPWETDCMVYPLTGVCMGCGELITRTGMRTPWSHTEGEARLVMRHEYE